MGVTPISPGTNSKGKGRKVSLQSSEEVKFLDLILQALANNGGILSAILANAGGGGATTNINHFDLSTNNDTETFAAADKYKSISFQVLAGEVDVTVGSDTVTYPVGANVNFGQGNADILEDVTVTLPSSGTNQTLIQTAQ